MGTLKGWGDLDADVARLLRMPKDVYDGGYSRKWPMPGRSESIELISSSDRGLKFFLDLREGAKSSSLAIGVIQDRKSTMQHRLSDRQLMRIDYADNQSVLKHRNPDNQVIVGTHIHLGITDSPKLPWAFPLDLQDVVSTAGGQNVTALFCAFQDACNITRRLKVDQLLGV